MRTAILRVTRNFGLQLLILLPVMFLFTVAGQAQTTGPTSVFQLNGDPATPTSGPLTCDYYGTGTANCDNWNLLNGDGVGPSPGYPGHSLTRTFVSGMTSTDVFTKGSKDTDKLVNWSCTSGSAPNKDALNAGYAAAYEDSEGQYNFIFGADRYSPLGDANIGIWFFKANVTPTCGSNPSFTGEHTTGDIFLISSFVGGGSTAVITAYEWDTGCTKSTVVRNPGNGDCADVNLRLLSNPGAANECNSGDPLCGKTNASGSVTSTWDNTLPQNTFFEGGMDIPEIFETTTLPCFSSFMVETRSSASTSAELKDFIIGNFNVCGMNITKNCGTSAADESGTSINYPVSGMVQNTGVGTLYNVTVCDAVTGSSTDPTPISVDNGSSSGSTTTLGPSGGSAPSSGTWSNTFSSPTAPLSDTAYAVAMTTNSGGTPSCDLSTQQDGRVVSSNTKTVSCPFSASSALTVSKSCRTSLVTDTSNNDVHVQVGYHGMVCNNGPSEVYGIGLTDYQASGSTTQSPALSTTTLGPCDTALDSNNKCIEQCVGLWDESASEGSETEGTAGSCVSTCPTGDTCVAGNCAIYRGFYTPTSDTPVSIPDVPNSAGQGEGRYLFSDTITVSSANAKVGSLTPYQDSTPTECVGGYGCDTATCPICDTGECPTP